MKHAAIALAALCATALVATAAEPTKRDDSASEKLGMKLSLQCWTYGRGGVRAGGGGLTLFEIIDKAQGLGVKYIEIFPGLKIKPDAPAGVTPSMTDEQIDDVKKKLASAGGIKVIAFGVGGIPTNDKEARKVFDWAKKMGIETLVTETTPNEAMDKLSQEYGIRVALHNHPATWPPDKVLEACKGRGKLLGSCSDTGHWVRAGFVPVESLKKLEGRVLHLHFKDINQYGKGPNDHKGCHDVVWGTGKSDIKGILTELKRQGYKGYMSIEFEFGDQKHLDENLPKCVAYFDRVMAELAK